MDVEGREGNKEERVERGDREGREGKGLRGCPRESRDGDVWGTSGSGRNGLLKKAHGRSSNDYHGVLKVQATPYSMQRTRCGHAWLHRDGANRRPRATAPRHHASAIAPSTYVTTGSNGRAVHVSSCLHPHRRHLHTDAPVDARCVCGRFRRAPPVGGECTQADVGGALKAWQVLTLDWALDGPLVSFGRWRIKS